MAAWTRLGEGKKQSVNGHLLSAIGHRPSLRGGGWSLSDGEGQATRKVVTAAFPRSSRNQQVANNNFMNSRIITLIGYRGCGKSTVGPLVASLLNCDCVDSDDVVEQQAGRSIADIFATDGEAEFRRLESKVLAELVTQSPLVIAAGGGAILKEENRTLLRNAGTVIWLTAPANVLASRITSDESTADRRPSLTGKSVADEVAEVLSARQTFYSDAAHHSLNVEDASPEEIANAVVALLPQETSS